jgi:hypothetical protein
VLRDAEERTRWLNRNLRSGWNKLFEQSGTQEYNCRKLPVEDAWVAIETHKDTYDLRNPRHRVSTWGLIDCGLWDIVYQGESYQRQSLTSGRSLCGIEVAVSEGRDGSGTKRTGQ